ncbi:hypothetical protein [Desulfovibrio desulfuricans]|uniref:hypothetical protein n=1 Tax=Desulfovibrio desulfuricans TaxID=876 RepID=UPI0003B35402|nr:hypothetical protein [Desulfovibrio desulfuricans]MDD3683892.1 hypothetical protein [Desulfovibrio desulfuricans]QTO41609.1 hypothetical protein J8J02_06880 [Desulfovibrio desulfuricans]
MAAPVLWRQVGCHAVAGLTAFCHVPDEISSLPVAVGKSAHEHGGIVVVYI